MTCGAPITRSVTQMTIFALNLLRKPKTEQIGPVSPIRQLGHVEKGADVFAKSPYFSPRDVHSKLGNWASQAHDSVTSTKKDARACFD